MAISRRCPKLKYSLFRLVTSPSKTSFFQFTTHSVCVRMYLAFNARNWLRRSLHGDIIPMVNGRWPNFEFLISLQCGLKCAAKVSHCYSTNFGLESAHSAQSDRDRDRELALSPLCWASNSEETAYYHCFSLWYDPAVGLEPATSRIRGERSTTEPPPPKIKLRTFSGKSTAQLYQTDGRQLITYSTARYVIDINVISHQVQYVPETTCTKFCLTG